jgi:adenosylmethionine-8-amino-7-oxononanoate aminotransferase
MRLPASLSREDVVRLERAHVWPPYTPRERHDSVDPFVIVGGEGAWIEDADGTRYLDASSSWWACTLGHGHPRLRAALVRQAEALMHVCAAGVTHAPIALLANEICDAAPNGLSRVHFSDDGSTAVEAALKIAFQYWQQNGRPERTRFLALAGAYHGDTIGAASVAQNEEFHRVFGPLLFQVIRAPHPDEAGGWDRVLSSIEGALAGDGDRIAGVFVEPLIQAAAGMRMYAPEVLRRIRAAASAVDTFLIADEVFTGYGRTGSMWACDLAGVSPDLMCVAKGFTAGVLPMAATLATDRIYDGFRGGIDRALMHGHTFCGNPLGAAVAREVLAIYRSDDVVGQVRRKAAFVARAFERLARLEGVSRVRTLGLVGAADLGDAGYRGGIGWRVFEEARKRGAYLRPLGDTVYVAPPLTIDERDLELLLSIVEDSTRSALRAS